MTDRVKKRIEWWLNDMAYKPPELLTGNRGLWYHYCMAKDIAAWDTDEESFEWSGKRLDPPQEAFA